MMKLNEPKGITSISKLSTIVINGMDLMLVTEMLNF